MDSSAYQILLLPVCNAIGFGLISGLVMHLTLEGIGAWLGRSATPTAGFLEGGRKPGSGATPSARGRAASDLGRAVAAKP